jgi:hypothetical protein
MQEVGGSIPPGSTTFRPPSSMSAGGLFFFQSAKMRQPLAGRLSDKK